MRLQALYQYGLYIPNAGVQAAFLLPQVRGTIARNERLVHAHASTLGIPNVNIVLQQRQAAV